MNNKNVVLIVLIGLLLGLGCGTLGPAAPLALVAVAAGVCVVLSRYEAAVFVLAAFGVIDTLLRVFSGFLGSVWDELFLILLVMLWIFKWITNRKDQGFKTSPMDIPLFIFIAAMLICLIINSPDFSIALEGFRAIVQYMLWYFVVLQILRGEKSAKTVTAFFVIVTGLLALHGIYQYIIGVEMPSGWVDQNEAGVRTRVYSIFTSPNVFGSLLTLAIPMAVSLAVVNENKKRKALFALIALLMMASLVFTSSRGAWIGFALAIGIYVLLKDKRLIVPCIIGAVILVAAVPSVGSRISYMLSPEYIESSLRGGRLVRWITGLKIFANQPVFGIGLGHFGGAVAMNHNLQTVVDTEVVKTFYMDNYMLKTAVESGIAGFSAFAVLIYSVIVNGFRTIKIASTKLSRELTTGIMAGLCGVIAHNFVENVFEVPMMTSLFWTFAAVVMNIWYYEFNKVNN
ncbi:MAG: O-antigen ligase family protein [Clostridia bacterium]|nr:O-antigen ligase family protein [Clostridia bacterium]